MWKEQDDQLIKTYIFKDFKEAFAFMQDVALIADQMDHHPWWANMYNEVKFALSTHDAGNKVTEKDHTLAAAIDKAASHYPYKS
ncbi:4a-hydroxytetrahydrobiopterin dehydratase [Dyadobacter tibetensis]|uniref:4a-hydroxytetrahydrobiopterin dehydratase n=1 Tax=Dyadobacter tibetensis TaxID=1211851 RepID=UPI0004708E6D|nr:4a-hydroxytetrahydrobiopterin dehydratase [Dyadobacter tibetensis]